jgi:hypothetical protein
VNEVKADAQNGQLNASPFSTPAPPGALERPLRLLAQLQ